LPILVTVILAMPRPGRMRGSAAPAPVRLRTLAERLGLVPDRRRAGTPVRARRLAWLALDRFDADAALAVGIAARGALQGGGELAGNGAGNLEHRLVGRDPDRADLGLG